MNPTPPTQTPIKALESKIDYPDSCPHDEHDHGICLSCGEDINSKLVMQAENMIDAKQDR